MKKTFTIVLLILVSVSLFASNGQKVIPLESDVYHAIDALYILEGKAVPSTTRPWTVAEARKILSKVSKETSAELYSIVEEAIGEKPGISLDEAFGMTFGGRVSLTGYAHTNTDYSYPFNEMANNLFRTDHDTSTFRLDWDTWVGDHLYSFVWYQYKNEFYNNGYDKYNFDFDVANLTLANLDNENNKTGIFTTNLDQREPSRAFFVLGGDSWSLEYGRDRLLIGAGTTGSLILSDTFPYHNLLRLSIFGSRYKYSFIMSFFPHLAVNDEKTIVEGGGGALFYMTHRLECRFLSDRLYAAINESVMYRSDDGFIDIRYVNPVMYFHNYFIKRTTNSILDFEASFSFSKGWNMYGQFVIDQFTSPIEMYEDEYNEPLAFGALLGLRNVSLAGEGVLTIGLEGAYTMPYLYLRDNSINNPASSHVQSDTDSGLGYIAAFRNRMFYIGYKYGGDAVVADLKVTYEVPSDWMASAEGLFMVHGEKNVRSLFRMDDDAFAPSGETWMFGLLELRARKTLAKKFAVYGQYDLILGTRGSDNQFTLGAEMNF